MTDVDDWYEDDDDRGGYREPDPEDYEIERSYAELAEHCERKHGGGVCDCRPARLALIWWATVYKLRSAWGWARSVPWRLRSPHTARVGPFEVTLRVSPRPCSACGGRGWFYTKGCLDPAPMPEGHDSASLCGCGSAIARLAEDRACVRRAQKEAPF